jgi:hypothetical protein
MGSFKLKTYVILKHEPREHHSSFVISIAKGSLERNRWMNRRWQQYIISAK